MITRWRQSDWKVRLEIPVAIHIHPEHGAAQQYRGFQMDPCIFNVLDYERFPGCNQQFPDRANKIRVVAPEFFHGLLAVSLARWARVDRIKLMAVILQILERIGVMKFERVSRLRVDIDSFNLKPSAMIAHPGATLAAKQI
jgi:hypothetical protein